MDPSMSKALWDGLTSEQKKAMAAIAADWQAGRQPEDMQMEEASDDKPSPPSSSSAAPSSSAPPSPVHRTLTIDEARAHYMDMVREEREEQFQEAQADINYNHNLLQEYLQAVEQVAAGRAVAPDADLAEQEAMLESYHSARKIRLAS